VRKRKRAARRKQKNRPDFGTCALVHKMYISAIAKLLPNSVTVM
jgi:hypothetical protein